MRVQNVLVRKDKKTREGEGDGERGDDRSRMCRARLCVESCIGWYTSKRYA